MSVREKRSLSSVDPQLAVGDGRLGLTYGLHDEPFCLFASGTFCDTHRDEGFHCPNELELSGEFSYPKPTSITWNGESFGICGTGLNIFSGTHSVFATVSASGELQSDPVELAPRVDSQCIDLVWSGERYVASIVRLARDEWILLALDRPGDAEGVLLELAELSENPTWIGAAAERLARVYEAMGNGVLAARWRTRAAEAFESAED